MEGVTCNETSATGATVNVAEPATEDEAAVIVVEPVATPVLKPALFTVAIVGEDEVHVAEAVRSWVVPSLYVPVALNCWVRPTTTDAETGVTAIETSDAGLRTVRSAEPLIDPDVADTVTTPGDMPVANPWLPPLLLILPTAGLDEVQVTDVVRS
jgi:hypothetical protein